MINDNLNENVEIEAIYNYIWYTETHTPYKKPSGNNSAYLGEFNGTGIYFHYEKGNLTTLDAEFLRSIGIPAENYLIYADECGLSEEYLRRHNITFKKIPRDIKKIWSNEI
jgi:adenine-specific DNA-methyltransferase